jgi:hypothetical protein
MLTKELDKYVLNKHLVEVLKITFAIYYIILAGIHMYNYHYLKDYKSLNHMVWCLIRRDIDVNFRFRKIN